ncbi:MAG: LysR substrate-binding domain-containing protein, partial [Candidatus Acidiferrales bacterium]
LILAAVPSVAAGLLPAALATFCKNHPQVDVRITELRSLFIPAAVADGICDVGVSVPPADGRVSFKQLFNDELVAVCRVDDPIAKMKSVPWKAFRSRPWIAFTHGNSIRAAAESIFQNLKIDITPKYECQYFSTIGRLIENGLGISVLSELMFKQIKTDCIVARPLVQPNASRSVGVVTRIGRTPPPAAKEILEALVTSVSHFRHGSTPVSAGQILPADRPHS